MPNDWFITIASQAKDCGWNNRNLLKILRYGVTITVRKVRSYTGCTQLLRGYATWREGMLKKYLN